MTSAGTPPLIVVGVDGSESSKAALRWAARQAELTGAELWAVQAWQPPSTYGMPVDYSNADFEAQVGESLRGTIVAALGERPDVPVSPQVVEGHPAAVLTQAAQQADLLVLGSHGRGAFAGMLLGSVSQHCVQHAPCPVLVTRAAPRS
ncbi:universal stress protein [Georgenia thermotolerans]|uniref:Universal stress protein n=1 Tax=Georgenia thermotolerans TaxID=527326 RepID=A0A7J5URK0_9MICO|nr:universal stress protein [Georgenia thermotolerans]KAE8764850.1 universal stress protein [Georgenia thermotolerans]